MQVQKPRPRPGAKPANPDVQLRTVERVEEILQAAPGPVSKTFLHQELEARQAGTTPARLQRILDYHLKHKMIVWGSKGIQWTETHSPSLERARSIGRKL